MTLFIPRTLSSRHDLCSLDNKATKVEIDLMKKLRFTCSCCGFTTMQTKACLHGGMEFLQIKGEYYLLCFMCSQSQQLYRGVEHAGESNLDHGILVYCPTLTQGQVIATVRDIYAMSQHYRYKTNKYLRERVRGLKSSFTTKLTETCPNIYDLNIKSNHIGGFAEISKYSPKELHDKDEYVFAGIRYIPDENLFADIVKLWLDNTYSVYLKRNGL
ncbi:MAG: hypothetical protein ACJAXJ_001188 [Colwellia sp.]|jgi:hypothetical protein